MKRLTKEDRALWTTVARSVRPMKRDRSMEGGAPTDVAKISDRIVPEAASLPQPTGVRAARTPPPARVRPDHAPRDSTGPKSRPNEAHTPPAHASPTHASLDRRILRRIARGHMPIDSRLDLHGMTREAARARLLDHLSFARACGQRTILVITGKGSLGGGVLRREVPLWFSTPPFRSLVASWDIAARPHGGEGALYVRLRR